MKDLLVLAAGVSQHPLALALTQQAADYEAAQLRKYWRSELDTPIDLEQILNRSMPRLFDQLTLLASNRKLYRRRHIVNALNRLHK